MLFQNSSIKELVFIVDKPNVMIYVVSCPNDKIRVFSINDVLKPSESSSHRNVTSAIIPPIPCTRISFYHSFFLSATSRFRTLTISPLKITSVNMSVWYLKHSDWIRMFLWWVVSVWWRSVFDHFLLIIILENSFKINIITERNLCAKIVWIQNSFKQI